MGGWGGWNSRKGNKLVKKGVVKAKEFAPCRAQTLQKLAIILTEETRPCTKAFTKFTNMDQIEGEVSPVEVVPTLVEEGASPKHKLKQEGQWANIVTELIRQQQEERLRLIRKDEEQQLWREQERKDRLDWERHEREASREEFKGLLDVLKGIQSPKGAHSPPRFGKKSGGGPKDIKIPKLSEEEDIKAYHVEKSGYLLQMAWEWVAKSAPCLTGKAWRSCSSLPAREAVDM